MKDDKKARGSDAEYEAFLKAMQSAAVLDGNDKRYDIPYDGAIYNLICNGTNDSFVRLAVDRLHELGFEIVPITKG